MAKKKLNKKAKTRIFLFFIIFGSIIGSLSYSFFSNVSKIIEIKNEKKTLSEKLVTLKDEEDKLNSDIKKLKIENMLLDMLEKSICILKMGNLLLGFLMMIQINKRRYYFDLVSSFFTSFLFFLFVSFVLSSLDSSVDFSSGK